MVLASNCEHNTIRMFITKFSLFVGVIGVIIVDIFGVL